MLRYPHRDGWSRCSSLLLLRVGLVLSLGWFYPASARAELDREKTDKAEDETPRRRDSRSQFELPDVRDTGSDGTIRARSEDRGQKGTSKSSDSSQDSSKPQNNQNRTRGGIKTAGSNDRRGSLDEESEGEFVGKVHKTCDYEMPLHQHEVAAGEHLGLIAGQYGVMRKDIITWNPQQKNLNRIRPGQILNICPQFVPREKLVLQHRVEKGENLASIAAKHDLTLRELLAIQSDKSLSSRYLRVGETIRIVVEGDKLPAFRSKPTKRAKRSRSGRRMRSRHRFPSGHRLPKSSYYRLKRPDFNYGTESTIRAIRRVVRRYHVRAKGPQLLLGDLSKRGGGPIRGHRSHRLGVDVDIGLILRGKSTDTLEFERATFLTLDTRRMWILVEELLKTGQVRYIFLDHRLQRLLYRYAKRRGISEDRLDEYFQYPRSRNRRHGIIRHWRGHDDHMHIRFRE